MFKEALGTVVWVAWDGCSQPQQELSIKSQKDTVRREGRFGCGDSSYDQLDRHVGGEYCVANFSPFVLVMEGNPDWHFSWDWQCLTQMWTDWVSIFLLFLHEVREVCPNCLHYELQVVKP